MSTTPGARVRLAEAMREIQKELAYYEAMIEQERLRGIRTAMKERDLRAEVGAAYSKLVAETRKVAGGIIRRSWNEQAITRDDEMHAPKIAEELKVLKPVEKEFLEAMAADVGGRPSSS